MGARVRARLIQAEARQEANSEDASWDGSDVWAGQGGNEWNSIPGFVLFLPLPQVTRVWVASALVADSPRFAL